MFSYPRPFHTPCSSPLPLSKFSSSFLFCNSTIFGDLGTSPYICVRIRVELNTEMRDGREGGEEGREGRGCVACIFFFFFLLRPSLPSSPRMDQLACVFVLFGPVAFSLSCFPPFFSFTAGVLSLNDNLHTKKSSLWHQQLLCSGLRRQPCGETGAPKNLLGAALPIQRVQ